MHKRCLHSENVTPFLLQCWLLFAAHPHSCCAVGAAEECEKRNVCMCVCARMRACTRARMCGGGGGEKRQRLGPLLKGWGVC